MSAWATRHLQLWQRTLAAIVGLLGGLEISIQAREDIVKLVKLVAVAAVIVPPFSLYYLMLGLADLGAALALTGAVMGASLYVFRLTQSLPLARDLFLSSFFCFLVFATYRFGTLVAPTSFWFAVIPVISVLLSGGRSGLIWLAIVLAGLVTLFALSEGSSAVHGPLEWPELFYAASLVSLTAAICLFVLMVDAARTRTLLRLRKLNESIEELARRDALTGLYNRRYIWEALQREEQHARETGSGFSILLLDLDNFKAINDTFGHVTGDIVLKDISSAIEEELRGAHLCGRYGGEEFLILLRSGAQSDPNALASQIRLRVAALAFSHVDGPKQVTVSGGIADYQAQETFAETFKRADQALYTAKATGRNRVVQAQVSKVARVA